MGQHVGLPRRAAALQGPLHQRARGLVEVDDRRVQPDVVEGLEVGGRFADRAAEAERLPRIERPPQVEGVPHVTDTHAQTGHGDRAGGEEVGRVRGGRGRVGREDPQGTEVHGVLGGLDVPERQVEWCEQVSGQWLALASTTGG